MVLQIIIKTMSRKFIKLQANRLLIVFAIGIILMPSLAGAANDNSPAVLAKIDKIKKILSVGII